MEEKPVPVAARSEAWVCGRSPADIVGSNPTGIMDVCLLWVLCVVRQRSLRRIDHSSRGALPTVARRCVLSRNLENEEAKARYRALKIQPQWVVNARKTNGRQARPSGRSVWGVVMRPLACWYCGFESHRWHGCFSVVSGVCCQVEVSATSWSLVQRSPTDCDASLWSRNLKNEEALARVGAQRHGKCKNAIQGYQLGCFEAHISGAAILRISR